MTREQLVEKRLGESGQLYKTIMLRAFNGEASPRQAIKAFCLHCTGEDRDAIRTCTALACPLFLYRPYTKGDE